MSRSLVAVAFFSLLAGGCKPPKGDEAPKKFVLSDEAQIQREMVAQATASGSWDAALAAADQLVALAPAWPEAHFTRADVRTRAGNAAGGPETWSVKEEAGEGFDSGTIEIFEDGRLVASMRSASDGSPHRRDASWTKVGGRYVAKHKEHTYFLTVEGNVIKGSVRFPDDGGTFWVKGTLKNRTEANPAGDPNVLLSGAAKDLAKYLVLKPGADDRESIVRSIASLRLRTPTANPPAVPPERVLDESQIHREMATQAAAAAKWETALAAADRTVELAPAWADAYFTRAGVRARERGVWSAGDRTRRLVGDRELGRGPLERRLRGPCRRALPAERHGRRRDLGDRNVGA